MDVIPSLMTGVIFSLKISTCSIVNFPFRCITAESSAGVAIDMSIN
jgi:hypothetical protein